MGNSVEISSRDKSTQPDLQEMESNNANVEASHSKTRKKSVAVKKRKHNEKGKEKVQQVSKNRRPSYQNKDRFKMTIQDEWAEMVADDHADAIHASPISPPAIVSHRCFLRELIASTANIEDPSIKLVWILVEVSHLGRSVDNLKFQQGDDAEDIPMDDRLSDGYESEDLESLDGDSNEGQDKFPMYSADANQNLEITIGMEFENLEVFKMAVRNMNIEMGRKVDFMKNDKAIVRAYYVEKKGEDGC
ncbi:hypothetical protein CRG98_015526 [Punica granatum]|uniref:Transposase MuDR plant domain-containing protein n=1 Tax=Punica granatum TaxID=22663 RepID=A0A2I0K698_PUNGR|nr:hypothetical protein CRG98_015526 [Punica granatum]